LGALRKRELARILCDLPFRSNPFGLADVPMSISTSPSNAADKAAELKRGIASQWTIKTRGHGWFESEFSLKGKKPAVLPAHEMLIAALDKLNWRVEVSKFRVP
jgi:hypothetical protein